MTTFGAGSQRLATLRRKSSAEVGFQNPKETGLPRRLGGRGEESFLRVLRALRVRPSFSRICAEDNPAGSAHGEDVGARLVPARGQAQQAHEEPPHTLL